jgi:hemin uptake protein HemP
MQHAHTSSAYEAPPAVSHDAAVAPWLVPVASGPRRLSSESLLGGAREVEIDHQGSIYRLKITSLGKLILTK